MGLFDLLRKKKAQETVVENVSVEKDKSANVEVRIKAGMVASHENDVIPAEQLMKTAYPSRNNGLYPHEILVLDYADSFKTQDNQYQKFWWNRYGIKNVDAVLQDLLKRGFISIAPITTTLEKCRVAEIKGVLDERGLNAKGKKALLIQSLLDGVSAEELNKIFPNKFYMRTPKGDAELKAEEYVPYIHCHSIEGLDIWSLNKLIYTSPSYLTYRDVIWQYLNQRSADHYKANDFGLYRNCRYAMATFLSEEGKVDGKLDMLAEVVFFDLSGAGNNFNPEYLYIIAPYLFPYDKSQATTYPAIVKEIFECQEKLGLTDETLRATLAQRMKKLSAPIELFEVEECVDIIFYEHANDKDSLNKIYKLAEERFHKKHPGLQKNPFL